MASNQNPVSDSLLESFDNLVAAGDTLPIEALKKRYEASQYFAGSYRQSFIYQDIAELPITVDMLLGDARDAVPQIVEALRRFYGDDLMFEFEGRGKSVRLYVRVWQPEEKLRKAWREFAEDEYKTKTLGGES